MQKKSKTPITKDNVISFIQGNWQYYKEMLAPSPPFLREQYHYRLSLCSDCLEDNACKYCDCPPLRKAWVPKSCNGGDRFPDLMNYEDWQKFKQEHNINIDEILTEQ